MTMQFDPISETRPVGRTKLRLPSLGFGASTMGNLYRPASDEAARATLNAALDAGMRYFDTAPHYGLGLSERRVGDAVRPLPRSDYVISTKVGRLMVPDRRADTSSVRYGFATPMPFDRVWDYTRDGILRSFEHSLQRLGLAQVEILFVHDIGRMTHGDENTRHFKDLADSGYRALDELRAAGVVQAIGLGVNETAVCIEAMEIGRWDCFLLAGRYTLLEQDSLDDFMPACAAHGASIVLGGPYNSGILATGVRGDGVPHFNYEPAPPAIIARVARLQGVCDAHGIEMAAAALQFPLAHALVASVIPGLGNARRVADTIRLMKVQIPASFWEELRTSGLLRPDAPVPGA